MLNYCTASQEQQGREPRVGQVYWRLGDHTQTLSRTAVAR
jgi:hypothetical protein